MAEQRFFFCSIAQYRQVKELNKVKASQSLFLALQKKYRCYWVHPTLCNCLSPSPTSMPWSSSEIQILPSLSFSHWKHFVISFFSRLVAFGTFFIVSKKEPGLTEDDMHHSYRQSMHEVPSECSSMLFHNKVWM